MIRHYPECPSASVAFNSDYCDCEYPHGCICVGCICVLLGRFEQKIVRTTSRAWEKFSRDQFDAGFSKGLDAAAKAVEAIPAPYKVRGQFETYGPYNEGVSDLKDVALSAIDALSYR